MSKRNFILFIIIIIIAIIAVFGYFYFNQNTNKSPEDDNPGTNFISQFNPFSKNNTTNPPPTPQTDIPTENPDPAQPEENLRLKKVSSMPIAGFTVFSKERLKEIPVPNPSSAGEEAVKPPSPLGGLTAKSKPTPPPTEIMPALRYVERSTGNIYQTFADKIEEKKFSNTIIPMVYEAIFGNKGNSVIMRYLKGDAKTIITFIGTLPKELLGADTADGNEIKGVFLPEDTKDISLSSDTLSIFYLFINRNNSEENIIGTTLNLSTNKKVQIFDSPFTEWLSSFPNRKLITFTTKPSSGIPGYMYAINPNNKNYNFNKILGGINGLTTLTSPDGKLILYSKDDLSLNIYNIDTKVSNTLGVKTLAEKCIWNKINDFVYCAVPKFIPSGSYPDSWYQGEVSFRDQIWKIDIKTGNATIIADLAEINNGEPASSADKDIDSIKLALDDNENYLFFVNKKDSFLWELELK